MQYKYTYVKSVAYHSTVWREKMAHCCSINAKKRAFVRLCKCNTFPASIGTSAVFKNECDADTSMPVQ